MCHSQRAFQSLDQLQRIAFDLQQSAVAAHWQSAVESDRQGASISDQ